MHIVQFDPSKFNHQHVICGDYVDEGNKAGIAVILIHGFPDLWYGWRHQIQFLVGLGRYRVIALDMLGYGGSDKPRSADLATDTDPTECHYHHNPAYSPRNVASHVVALLDHLGVEKTVLVGHDWGTGIVSRGHVLVNMAHHSIGNPFRPITKELMTINDYVNENPAFQYFEHFVSPEAVQDFDERIEDIANELFSEENGHSEEDRAYYLSSLKRGGFHGPLAYYKTFKASHQEEQYLIGKRFAIPTLLLIVNNDPILHPEYCLQVPKDYFDNLEIDYVETGEHWILTQNPDTVNRKLERYLGKISSSFDYQARKSTPSIKSTIGSLVRRRTSAVLRIPAVAAGETDFKNWSSVPGGIHLLNMDFSKIHISADNPDVLPTLTYVLDNLQAVEERHAEINSKPTVPEYAVSSFNHKYATLNGYKYHYVEEGDPNNETLILIHGFPDLWYGWRYQIRHLVKQGYHVIADHPRCDDGNYDPYRTKNLASNLIALADHLNLEKAVWIGHDWGANVVLKLGLFYPERCLAVINIGVPYAQPQAEYLSPFAVAEVFPQFKYFAVFQTKEPETWFNGDEKQYYIDRFSHTTLHGGINYYRATFLNYQDELPYVGKPYTVPVLQVAVEKDPILTPEFWAVHKFDTLVNLEEAKIPEGGHNVHTENAEGTNKVLTEYLAKMFGKKDQQQQEQTKVKEE
ncbi:hypothetical protein BGZ54_006965 [Gamsiella multidivaricata]|nr:hypothetical protein BGZ54_006965 [Gamsiella multidivaricata]